MEELYAVKYVIPPYLEGPHEQCIHFPWTIFSGIDGVLLIFHSSIAIPIPELQYCIAIQNSKTCSSLLQPITIYLLAGVGTQRLTSKMFLHIHIEMMVILGNNKA